MLKITQMYPEDALYFSTAREEVLDFFESPVEKVLEIGCGAGATLVHIKNLGLANYTVGVDINEDQLTIASKEGVDVTLLADPFNLKIDCEEKSFDKILLLDVLEHMINPWETLNYVKAFLRPNGSIIISIPNVQNLRVIVPLLFGQWEYKKSGILDVTHLRFFTKKSCIKLVKHANLEIFRIKYILDDHKIPRIVNIITCNIFRRFITKQFLIECKCDY